MEYLRAQSQMPAIQKDGLGVNEYHRAYLDFRQAGEHENALRSLETVLELQQRAQQEVQRRQEGAYELAWRQEMEAVAQKDPSVFDGGTPLHEEVDRIVNEHPYLFYVPQGFSKAVEIATLILGAGSDSELREELAAAYAEIERLNGSKQPLRGGPGRPPEGGPKQIEDMTDDELERHMAEITAEGDRSAWR